MTEETLDAYLTCARCDPALREAVLHLAATGHSDEALPLLAKHRLRLLSESHEACMRLDHLDRAICIIKQREGTRGQQATH